MNNAIGDILRKWRKQRRYSQLQLALEVGISSKHVSFLETGRSMPSRAMILRIGEFLFLPKQEINRGLNSAGYAPFFTELAFGHEDLKPVVNAIDHMISNHMPYPAIVLNQNWDVVKANDSAKTLLNDVGYSGYTNLLEALIHDDPNTSKIVNWRESALAVLVRLRHEISALGGASKLEAFEEKLTARLIPYDETENYYETANMDSKQAILSTQFKVADCVLSFFSILSQLSTIQDVTVSEFKIELMFPSDETTKRFYNKNN